MPPCKDHAICIRSRNYSETSQIVTLFGRDSGKISAIAKGSRRPRGNFSGGIDLLTVAAIVFIPARPDATLATLSEFQLTRSFIGLRHNLLALNCGLYAAHLLAEFTEQLDPHPVLYDALYAALERLERDDRPDSVLLTFELVLLQQSGLMPIWHNCSNCSGQLPAGGSLYFSSRIGGMLCDECESAVVEKRLLEPSALRLLQEPQTAQNAPPSAVCRAHELLSYHQRELLGKEPAVMLFVNRLLRQYARTR